MLHSRVGWPGWCTRGEKAEFYSSAETDMGVWAKVAEKRYFRVKLPHLAREALGEATSSG